MVYRNVLSRLRENHLLVHQCSQVHDQVQIIILVMCDELDYDFCWPEQKDVASEYVLVSNATDRPPTAERPLDKAMRTNNQALRCYCEEHGEEQTKSAFHLLSAEAQAAYKRLPIVANTGLPSGTFFIRTFKDKVLPITDQEAADHPMFAYQAL